MKKKIVAVVQYKIRTTDAILPLMMELAQRHPDARVHFVLPDDETLSIIRRNEDIWAALEDMGAKVTAVRGPHILVSLFRYALLLLGLCRSRVVLFKFADNLPRHAKVVSLLKQVSDMVEVKCFLPPEPYGPLKSFHDVERYKRAKRNKPLRSKLFDEEMGKFDYYATTVSAQEFRSVFHLDPPEDRLLQVGYVRALPAWRRFYLKQIASGDGVPRRPYALVLLGGLGGHFSAGIDEPSEAEMLAAMLELMKPFQDRILTVFKPHATTSIEKLKGVCDLVGFTNWEVSYRHPMILSAGAEFALSYYFSNAMFDTHFLGKPTAEYCMRHEEIVQAQGGSQGLEYCDFFTYKDPDKFTKDLEALVSGEFEINRGEDFMKESFPETSPQFFEAVDDILQGRGR